MKKLKNRGEVPKNIYSKICKNPVCAISFECNHANRGFCSERCKRNYERDQKVTVRDEIKRKAKLMNMAKNIFEEQLRAGKNEITKTEMKSRNVAANIFTVRVRSLAGEIIYVYEDYLLHKISEDKFRITKI
jgi:uncharacterized protein (DUF342 family)